jgi:hypothetical protein
MLLPLVPLALPKLRLILQEIVLWDDLIVSPRLVGHLRLGKL